ncbi:NAD(P)-binding protein [Flagelloscypha sp. PMI_526]|nr:NAD(P)-binding protein [Flagelloscypha sp. PMI_526]
MPSLATAKASNAGFSPNYLPVAVFFGATRGIGAGMAQAFARATNGNCHLIILGRNRQTAEDLIATFPRPTALGAKHEFVQCDATLMKNVQRATDDILTRVDRINFIALSLALLEKVGPDFTEEGLDRKLTTVFYGRWKFVHNLLPALERAVALGQDATVYNVGGGGRSKGRVSLDNLGFKKSVPFLGLRSQIGFHGNVVMQCFSAANPKIAWVNAYPGFVHTGILDSVQDSWLYYFIAKFLHLVGPYFAHTVSDSGEYMTYAMLRASANSSGEVKYVEDLGNEELPAYQFSDEDRQKVWEHFVDTALVVRT